MEFLKKELPSVYRILSMDPIPMEYAERSDELWLEEAKKNGDHRLLGEVCYRLYDLGVNFRHRFETRDYFGNIACSYGTEGIPYNENIKFRAMADEAVYEEMLNRKLSLGFDRDDAIKYMRELQRKGDPRWKELSRRLDNAASTERVNEIMREEAKYESEKAARKAEQQRQEERERELRKNLKHRRMPWSAM